MRACNVSYCVDGVTLLHDFSCQLKVGTTTIIIGPNGSGKSTALHLLAGDLGAREGSVTINDKAISLWPLSELARIRAVLPQQSSLEFPFTVAEVVTMGTDFADHDMVLSEVTKACGVDSLLQRIYTGLSGGEKQRVQIARVLAQVWSQQTTEQRFLLLDEPVNQLDIKYQYQILDLLSVLKENGVAVCVILHNLALVALYADHVILLDQGCVVASGSVDEVLDEKHIADIFGVTMKQAGLLMNV